MSPEKTTVFTVTRKKPSLPNEHFFRHKQLGNDVMHASRIEIGVRPARAHAEYADSVGWGGPAHGGHETSTATVCVLFV